MNIPCANCGKILNVYLSRVRASGLHFCNRDCDRQYRLSPQAVAARFWSKVDKSAGPDGCWMWLGSRNRLGYAMFRVKPSGPRNTLPVARVAYELTYGEADINLFACHRCDTPGCVNPAHIFMGTPADNSADMAQKQRSAWGERAPKAKLTREQVVEIRNAAAQGESLKALARRFGVSDVNIGLIVARKIWRNVP